MNGSDVRSLRKRLGMTQQDFAGALGVSLRSVLLWENENVHPSKLAQRALAELARTGQTTTASTMAKE